MKVELGFALLLASAVAAAPMQRPARLPAVCKPSASGAQAMTKADVTIRWPQGAVETFKDVAANQLIVAREGEGIVERRPLPPAVSAAEKR